MKLREYIEQQDTLEMYSVRSGSKVFPVVKLPKLGDIARVLLPVGTLFLWFISLKAVDIGRMNDLGLISVLPPSIIIALIILTISFCLTLRQPQIRSPMLLLHLVLLIFMLYSITILLEKEPGTPSVYQRAGLTEYIMRTGSVNP